jgi:hypothetical protein
MKLISDIHKPDIALMCIGDHYPMGTFVHLCLSASIRLVSSTHFVFRSIFLAHNDFVNYTSRPTGPDGAAYALDNLLESVKTVFPMHFGTFPLLHGTPDQLKQRVKKFPAENIKELKPGDTAKLD